MHRSLRTLGALALATAVAAAGASGASASDELDAAGRDAPRLELDAFLYGWVTGTYGSIALKDTTVRIDVTPADVLDLLFDGDAFAAAGYFALSYDRFSVFADSMGGYADIGVFQSIPTQLCCTLTIDAKDRMKFVITDVGLGYELGRWTLPGRPRPLSLGVWAGARYVYLSNELDATFGVVQGAQGAANVSDSIDWADPLIGVRWSLPLLESVSIDFRGDIGGFTASSDLTWGLLGMVRLWIPYKPFDLTPYLAAGYRVVAFDRSPDAGSVDMQMRGPTLGAGFLF
jgi:hypothetical protein